MQKTHSHNDIIDNYNNQVSLQPDQNLTSSSDWVEIKRKNKNVYKAERDYKFNKFNKFNKYDKNTNIIKKKWIQVNETWNDYINTLKKIDIKTNKYGEKNCDWIYKILVGKQELEFVECVTKEFLIIPVGFKKFESIVKTTPSNFNLLVIPFDYQLRTIRDLRHTHIPLLNKMREKALEVINRYVKICDLSNLHCEFHYTPSTYHLHLHIGLGKEIEVDGTKRHLIHNFSDVINNLEIDPEYYTKPVLINVRNILDWKSELDEYKNLNLNLNSNSNSNETLEKSNSFILWKLFENMDCYKNYN